MQAGSFLVEVSQLVAEVALEAPSRVIPTPLLTSYLHLMVVAAPTQPQVQLLLRLPQTYFHTKTFQGLIGLLTIVANEAEGSFLASKEGHLGEGYDLVAFVYLLVNKVPDVDVLVDVAH